MENRFSFEALGEPVESLAPYFYLLTALMERRYGSRPGSDRVQGLHDFLLRGIAQRRAEVSGQGPGDGDLRGSAVAFALQNAAVIATLGHSRALEEALELLHEFRIPLPAGLALALTEAEHAICQIEHRPYPFVLSQRFSEILSSPQPDLPQLTTYEECWRVAFEIQDLGDSKVILAYTSERVPPDVDVTFRSHNAPGNNGHPQRTRNTRPKSACIPHSFHVHPGECCTLCLHGQQDTRIATFRFTDGISDLNTEGERLAISLTREPLPLHVLRESRKIFSWRLTDLQRISALIRACNVALPFGVLLGERAAHLLLAESVDELSLVQSWIDRAEPALAFWWSGDDMVKVALPDLYMHLAAMSREGEPHER